MRTIWADFNAQTVAGYISLLTQGSQASLAQNSVQPGEWVWLSDGDINVAAQIMSQQEGLYAKPIWETEEDVVQPVDLDEDTLEKARLRFQRLMISPAKDYREMLRLLRECRPSLAHGGSFFGKRVCPGQGCMTVIPYLLSTTYHLLLLKSPPSLISCH